MQEKNISKTRVLFVLFDANTETPTRNTPPGWTPLTFLCANPNFAFARVHFFYWRKEAAIMHETIAGLESANNETAFSSTVLPCIDMEDINSSPENKYSSMEFLYDWVTTYHFDYYTEIYYFYFQGAHSFFRSVLFYFGTKRMANIGNIEIQPPSLFPPCPAKILETELNLSVYESMANIIRDRRYDSYNFLKGGIHTRNVYFNNIIEQIEFVAVHSRDPILILGPTGAGKSALVKRIYKLKAMHKNISGPFVDVNCASIRGDSAQSMLFGHARGSFTGALAARSGLLRTAHLGLLFLDEIGVLGLEEQALLLKAVEDKTFLPLGTDKEVSSNFQMICGTNLDLVEEVRQGRFRADLFARINMWTFTLPGLAQRPEDIEPNLDFELSSHEEKSGKHIVFSHNARNKFLEFATSPQAPWPGNFRDFTLAVRRMSLLADSGVIGVSHVDDEIQRLTMLWNSLLRQDQDTGDAFCLCRKVLGSHSLDGYDTFDLIQLEEVLKTCEKSESISQAGRTLFSASRSKRQYKNDSDRLRKYLAKWGIPWVSIKQKV